MEFNPFEGFQFWSFLKISVTDFYEPKKARKLKVPINMDNGGMYRVSQNRGKGFITLGAMLHGSFFF